MKSQNRRFLLVSSFLFWGKFSTLLCREKCDGDGGDSGREKCIKHSSPSKSQRLNFQIFHASLSRNWTASSDSKVFRSHEETLNVKKPREKYFSKHCGLHKQVLALKQRQEVNREKQSRQNRRHEKRTKQEGKKTKAERSRNCKLEKKEISD